MRGGLFRWISIALLIGVPCFLALVAYDWVAVVVLGRGPYRLIPWHDLARGMVQDLGLTLVYAVTVTPRVVHVIADYSEKARRVCLIMLGLGLAWYEVICAWVSRQIGGADLAVSLVMLFVVPFILAPSYVRWLRTKVPEDEKP